MNHFVRGLCAALAVAFVVTIAASPALAHDHKGYGKEKQKNIVETAIAADGFETLVAAVKAAGLVEALSGEGPFTVFAPTDAAFAALPEGTLETLLKPENKDQLVSILTYHVVPAKVPAEVAVTLDEGETLNGQKVSLEFDGETLTVDGAKVVKSDIMTSNGVIHVIDKVILPGSGQSSR